MRKSLETLNYVKRRIQKVSFLEKSANFLRSVPSEIPYFSLSIPILPW